MVFKWVSLVRPQGQREKDPRPKDCKKIQGEENLWRIRIGDYRIIYEIDDEKRSVDINNIRHRKEAYR